MYGKDVTVEFRGQLKTVFVSCTPTTSHEELELKALWKLQRTYEHEKFEKNKPRHAL